MDGKEATQITSTGEKILRTYAVWGDKDFEYIQGVCFVL